MRLLPIIHHLRTTMPLWFQHVDAGATMEYILDKSRLALPAFYLKLGDTNSTNVIYQPEIVVDYTEPLLVIAVLKNVEDETGKYAQDQVHWVRKALVACLLGYIDDEDSSCFAFINDRMIDMDKARYVHEFMFNKLSRFDASDGLPLTLDNFNKLYADWNLTDASEETQPNAQDQITDIYQS